MKVGRQYSPEMIKHAAETHPLALLHLRRKGRLSAPFNSEYLQDTPPDTEHIAKQLTDIAVKNLLAVGFDRREINRDHAIRDLVYWGLMQEDLGRTPGQWETRRMEIAGMDDRKLVEILNQAPGGPSMEDLRNGSPIEVAMMLDAEVGEILE